ncbi:hypothetical protein BX666DRAFT_2010815 [Dichotomocladium elegans]|nr:hypothetical protein BX666DRAFT_2010815 [Dichotomocladium elegans]
MSYVTWKAGLKVLAHLLPPMLQTTSGRHKTCFFPHKKKVLLMYTYLQSNLECAKNTLLLTSVVNGSTRLKKDIGHIYCSEGTLFSKINFVNEIKQCHTK